MKKIGFYPLSCFCFDFLPKKRYVNTKITAETIAIDSATKPDTSFVILISPFKKKMIKEINTVLTYTPKDLVRTDGKMQSSLGNLMADLCYSRANPVFKKMAGKNIDFTLLNYGGIRSGIFKGKVTYKNAFELMPFENTLVVTELTGDKIEALVRYFITQKRAHPLSKQIQLTITKNRFTLQINGQPFDRNKTYHVLTHDYLQSGGDRMVFFKDPVRLYDLKYKVRDAIVDHFKSVDTLTSALDNRVILN